MSKTQIVVLSYMPPQKQRSNPLSTTEFYGFVQVRIDINESPLLTFRASLRINSDNDKMVGRTQSYSYNNEKRFSWVNHVLSPKVCDLIFDLAKEKAKEDGVEFGVAVVSKTSQDIDELITGKIEVQDNVSDSETEETEEA